MHATHEALTPFGQRPMSLRHLATQIEARAVTSDQVVHKWHLLSAVRDARALLGATDRSLAILEALLACHPETALSGPEGLIVWPSNQQLCARANGMSEPTLRRHIAVLVGCGLIIRRDSPNGKRFARKGPGGTIEQAFGFDLSPLVARAPEIYALAEKALDERRALRQARETYSLLRRDVQKMIDTGLHEDVPADWRGFLDTYQDIVARLPRSARRPHYEALAGELRALHAAICNLLISVVETSKMNGNAGQNERQIQNTADPVPVSCNKQRRSHDRQVIRGPYGHFASEKEAPAISVGSQPRPPGPGPQSGQDLTHISLGLVKSACPDVVDLLPEAFGSWPQMRQSAGKLCRLAYINPQVWDEAQRLLGPDVAICALIITVQRSWMGLIQASAGGYMRALVQRGCEGQLNLAQSFFALAKTTIGRTQ